MRTFAAVCLPILIGLSVAHPASSSPAGMAPAPQIENPVVLFIGPSVGVLNGPWRFHPGDDLAWAQSGYDDSGWATMDLTPPEGSTDPVVGNSGYTPGWTAKGFPELSRYAWYRMRVRVENPSAGDATALSLKMPDNFDDAFQVYVNGELIGAFGRFTPGHVTIFGAQPAAFPLPAAIHRGPITIAIRMWMEPATRFESQDAGGLHGPPMLGEARSIDAMLRLHQGESVLGLIGHFVSIPLEVVVLALGLVLFALDRREPAYLWLALACSAHLLSSVTILMGDYSTWIPLVPSFFCSDVVAVPLTLWFWIAFWASWFRLDKQAFILKISAVPLVLQMVGLAMLRAPFYGTVVPASTSTWLLPLTVALKLAMGLAIFWVVLLGTRKDRTEGLLAAPAMLLTFLRLYQDELVLIHVPVIFNVFGAPFTMGSLALMLTLAVISLLMLRRFMRGLKEKQRLEVEMEQARQVQHVLIPEELPRIAGFEIESEYRPAQQVGGDFFQILRMADGAVLLVIGDVSGKGMPAAMTVSLLVGTVRTELDHTDSPGKLLATMNARMIGRAQGGFTTCLAIRMEANGRATAANAGHLAPYLNGCEVELKSDLPLGLNASTAYAETTFQVNEGDLLTLLTDGVVEARAVNGELFGFERTATISQGSPGDIAQRAEEFGQNDDITVVTLKRLAAKVEATVHVATPTLAPRSA